MTVTQYIGARYVPLFGGEWDVTKQYEPLTIVSYQGNSYTSVQAVPSNIAISNTEFWAQTGNYNAQIEAYRQEVQTYNDRITANASDIDAIEDLLPSSAFSSTNTIDARFDTIDAHFDTIEADNWVNSSRIAANAITTAKITDEAVTTDKIDDEAVTDEKLDSGIVQLVRSASRELKGANVVCISDSYGRGVGGTTDHGWPYFVGSWGRTNSLLNVSNSGAGFIATGHSDGLTGLNFSAQLDYALAHLPSGITANDIDIVIVAGGYNDHAQSGQYQAAYDTMRKAQNNFPNASLHMFPLCAGDRALNNEYINSYINLCHGAAETGAQVHNEALYWLYPYEIETSYGDNIHPNNTGYRYIAAFIMGSIAGGTWLPNTFTLAASAEGFTFAQDATNNDFRALVQNGVAYFGGRIDRVGGGLLCTLPSYCRPRQTTYIPMFVYADSDHHGIARCRIYANGNLEFMTMESGTYDSTLTYQCYVPCTSMPLGHVIF